MVSTTNCNPDSLSSNAHTDLEYIFTDSTHPTLEHTTSSNWFNQTAAIRQIMKDIDNILRRYRFHHHQADRPLRVPPPLYHACTVPLSNAQWRCHEPPTRRRSMPARHRWRTYVRTALTIKTGNAVIFPNSIPTQIVTSFRNRAHKRSISASRVEPLRYI